MPATLTAQQVPQERTIPLEDEIKQEMEQSRFHLGPVRLLPKLALNNTGYDNNIFGTRAPTVSDWTSNVSAGFHMVAPLGTKTYVRGDALPEYDWYAHHVEKRTLGGRYSVSLLGFFNRMSTEFTGDSTKTVAPFSSENEIFVLHRDLDGVGRVDVNLARRLLVLAEAEGHRLRYESQGTQVTPLSVEALDRDEIAGRAGVEYQWSTFFHIAGEIEGTQTNFLRSSQRDNRTTAYLLGIYYNRERLFVNLNGGYRVGRPNDSSFAPFSTGTGSYFISYFLTKPLEFQAYGHRSAGYSLTANNAYYFETRNGAAMTVRLGRRFSVRGYGEYGTNDYATPVPVAGGFGDRVDHFTTVGGGVTTLLLRNASLSALVYRENVSSNAPAAERKILRFTTNLTFQGLR